MRLPFYQVNAFADHRFGGGPAGVVPLEAFLPEDAMQAIAAEQNLAETAFIVPAGAPGRYHLRWFTPTLEVPLCGHATLAAGSVALRRLAPPGLETVRFLTRSGELSVRRAADGGFVMRLPAALGLSAPDAAAGLAGELGLRVAAAYESDYGLAVLADPADLARLPRERGVAASWLLGRRPGNLVVAARSDTASGADIAFRFFAPGSGIAEDPATGSAVCLLASVFAEEFPGRPIRFLQAYPGRGARIAALWDRAAGQVEMAGGAIETLEGVMTL